jgi:hypothetical protein
MRSCGSRGGVTPMTLYPLLSGLGHSFWTYPGPSDTRNESSRHLPVIQATYIGMRSNLYPVPVQCRGAEYVDSNPQRLQCGVAMPFGGAATRCESLGFWAFISQISRTRSGRLSISIGC